MPEQGIADSVSTSPVSEALSQPHDTHAVETFDNPSILHSITSSTEDILADLLNLQATRPEWTSTWTTNMSFTNFMAGHDTITSSLTSVMVYICTSPSTLSRVREEFASAISSGTINDPKNSSPTYDSLTENLPYLAACIKEAMRLRPVVGMSLVRVTPASGAVIDGVAVPGGTIVGNNTAAVNRSGVIFGTTANDFKPERWIDDLSNNDNGNEAAAAWSRNNLAWGGPSRSCPGQHMARLIMLKFLVVVFRSCRFEVLDKGVDGKGFLSRMMDVKAKVVVDPVIVGEDSERETRNARVLV
jgi:cytochrome P450